MATFKRTRARAPLAEGRLYLSRGCGPTNALRFAMSVRAGETETGRGTYYSLDVDEADMKRISDFYLRHRSPQG